MFCYCSGISIYPFIAFVVDIILTMIVEYFWDLHCLAVVCCFQLCLFYFSLSGTTILTVFVLVIALFVCTVSYFSRSCWVHVFLLSVLYAFLFVY